MNTRISACPGCGARNRVPAVAAGLPRCAKCGASLPWIVEAEDTDFGRISDSSRLPVLVDLWAPWCGYCRRIAPAVEALADELDGRIRVAGVNVDDAPDVAARFGVNTIPTLLLFKDGRLLGRPFVGPRSQADIREYLSANGVL